MSKLTDRLKHMVVEDAPAPAGQAPTTKAAAQPAPAVPIFQPVMPMGAATTAPASIASFGTTPVQVDEEVYKRVLAKTDFEVTDTAALIHKYLDPLTALPLDPATKFKTAVAQAKSIDGLSEEKILATYDGLKVALQHEAEVFQQNADNFVAREVKGREDKLNQLQQQINDLQAQLQQVSQDYAAAQTKAANAQTQFNLAVQRRASELDQQKAQTASNLR